MTNQEAIERIERHIIIHGAKEPHAVYITEALNMAIEALKAQEPRVMSPDEIEAMKMGEVAWCEEYYDGPGFLYPMVSCGRGDLGNLYIGINAIGFYDPHRRFWSARPTDEQRKATPWEPPKEG